MRWLFGGFLLWIVVKGRAGLYAALLLPAASATASPATGATTSGAGTLAVPSIASLLAPDGQAPQQQEPLISAPTWYLPWNAPDLSLEPGP